eukprot:TRINITY_DN991_c0_g1_i1.p1 TRINITY_DN991_c0_g1~~TRINITY_DN991_c0_g1_i1.p1  ORF type:complete len:345 (+),score=105.47 TRINITY_DN991_c0_g1_i1:91-1035(+)
MKSILAIVGITLLALASAQVFSASFTSPLFLWSNTKVFNGQNLQVSDLIQTQQLFGAMMGQKNDFSKYVNDGVEPEVIVLFIEPQLRSEQFPMLAQAYDSQPHGGAFTNLKALIEGYAASSIVIPYSTPRFSAGSMIRELIPFMKTRGGSVFVARDSDFVLEELNLNGVQILTLDALKQKADGKWDILSNGKTDLIVVGFNSPVVDPENIQIASAAYAKDDQYIKDVVSGLGQDYVAAFTSNKAVDEDTKEARKRNVKQQLLAATEDGSIFPPAIIEAVIVMIPFILILYVGVSCSSAVQSVLKFDAELDSKRR